MEQAVVTSPTPDASTKPVNNTHEPTSFLSLPLELRQKILLLTHTPNTISLEYDLSRAIKAIKVQEHMRTLGRTILVERDNVRVYVQWIENGTLHQERMAKSWS